MLRGNSGEWSKWVGDGLQAPRTLMFKVKVYMYSTADSGNEDHFFARWPSNMRGLVKRREIEKKWSILLRHHHTFTNRVGVVP